jgi:serine/threonine protein kinase
MTSCFLLRVANDVSRSLAAKAMTDFKVKAVLGVGAFGKVLLCRHPDSKGVFAVKQLSKAQIIAAQLQHHVRQERYERESPSMYTYVFSPTAFSMFTITVAYFLNSLTCVHVYPPVCLSNKRRDVMKDCDTPFLVRLVATFQDPVSIFYFSCGRLD